MAGDAMEIMPMSPRRSPADLGNAVLQWAMSRRGRVLVITAVFALVFLGLSGVRHSEVGCLETCFDIPTLAGKGETWNHILNMKEGANGHA